MSHSTYSVVGGASVERQEVSVNLQMPEIRDLIEKILELSDRPVRVEAPIVNVAAPNVHMETPAITVEAPKVVIRPEFVVPVPDVLCKPEIKVNPSFNLSPAIEVAIKFPKKTLVALLIGIYLLIALQAFLIFQNYYPSFDASF